MHNFNSLTPHSNSSSPKTFGQSLSKIKSSAQKCFVSEKIKCIILAIWHRIRIPHPRKSLIKHCRKSVSRPKTPLLARKLTAQFRPTETGFEFLGPRNVWSNFVQNQDFTQKWALTDKVDCVVSTSCYEIGFPRPRKGLMKVLMTSLFSEVSYNSLVDLSIPIFS